MKTSLTRLRPALFPLVLGLAILFATSPLLRSAQAEEEPRVPGPRSLPPDDEPTVVAPTAEQAAAPSKRETPKVRFNPRDFELLPIHDIERIRLARDHKGLVYRLQTLVKRQDRMRKQLEGRKNKKDDGAEKLKKEIRRVGTQLDEMSAKAVDAMRPFGVTDQVLALVARAPRGPYKIERYAHSLVLALDDLTAAQRALFERLVPEVNSAYFTLMAQRKRLEMVGKQANLERDAARQLRATVEQQVRLMDKRFWRVVDYTLTEDQRYQLKDMLPGKHARLSNPIEHLYALPDLAPSQGARLQAVLTAAEAEMAPDQALVKRNRQLMKATDLAGPERKALQNEMKGAQERLQDLQLWSSDTVKEILTEQQLRAYKAIPPRISTTERRRRAKQMLEGVPLSERQKTELAELQREYREVGRAMQKQITEIRRKGADFGADSPQMGMMQMEMAGVQAQGQVRQREALGRVLIEILELEQVSGWVLGYYGQMR